ATLAEAEIANYPFTTIKPNRGIGFVKIACVDQEFNKQCNPREGYCLQHKRFVPFEMLDVAGLVPGAHQGLGRGNAFLSDLNEADALIHVIDVSGSVNEKGEAVEPLSYDPGEDIRFLEVELDMWYFGILQKGWEKFARQVQQEKTKVSVALAKQLSGLRVDQVMIEKTLEELHLHQKDLTAWNEDDLKKIAGILRKKTKPMILACNKVDIPGAFANFERLQKTFPHYMMIACSAESELALKEAAKHGMIDYIPGEKDFVIKNESKLNEAQKKGLDFIKKNMLEKYNSTGVQHVLDTMVLEVLKYIAIYPGGINNLVDSHGRVLPDCFLMPAKSTALDFAYRLHTDFGKKFIRAINVKTKMTIGRDHVLQHKDVVEIVSGK
ncbi:redox-regulated ATPase YchF, partial [Candidatus Woesearchaeota archaeon]|nr:redox-regulated ATPase YchF [Candidatus Woesearchaeota archaeon]